MNTFSRGFRTFIALAITSLAVVALPAGASALVPSTVHVTTSPPSHDFGNHNVSAAGDIFVVTVSNSPTSTGSWTYAGSSFSGDEGFTLFSDSNCFAQTLAPGGSCTVSVKYEPALTGTENASFTPMLGTAIDAQTTTFTGKGTAPTADLSNASYDFGQIDIHKTAPSFNETISNNGVGPLTVTNFGFSGTGAASYSADASNCGAGPSYTVAQGASCFVKVTFAPSAVGQKDANLTFDLENGVLPSASVSLTGVGNVQSLHAQDANWFFATRDVSAGASAAGMIHVDNDSSVTDDVNSITITGPNASEFAVASNTCGTQLASLATCTASVTFDPSSAGAKSANLHFVYDSPRGSVDIPITANGIDQKLDSVTTSLGFGDRTANSGPSGALTATFNNPNAPLFPTTVNSVTVTGADASSFAVASQNCVGQVAGHADCAAQVTFNPTSAGAKSASLHVVFDSPRFAVDVPLSGNGLAAAGPPAPTISATALKPLKLKKLVLLGFTAGCGSQSCTLKATSRLMFKAKGKTKRIVVKSKPATAAAGAGAKLVVAFSKSQRKAMVAAKKVTASTVISATGAGGTSTVTITAKLK